MIKTERLQNWQAARQGMTEQWENFYQEHRDTVRTVAIVTLAGATGTVVGLFLGKGLLVAKGVTAAKVGATQAVPVLNPVATAASLKSAVTLLGQTAAQGASLADKAIAFVHTLSTNAVPLTAGAVGGGAAGVGATRYQVRQVKDRLNTQVQQTVAAQNEAQRLHAILRSTEENLSALQARFSPQAIADDLEAIHGIGRVIAQRLKDAGIATFADLAAQTPEHLRAIVATGRVAATMNPEAWIAEARQRLAGQSPTTPSAAPTVPGESA